MAAAVITPIVRPVFSRVCSPIVSDRVEDTAKRVADLDIPDAIARQGLKVVDLSTDSSSSSGGSSPDTSVAERVSPPSQSDREIIAELLTPTSSALAATPSRVAVDYDEEIRLLRERTDEARRQTHLNTQIALDLSRRIRVDIDITSKNLEELASQKEATRKHTKVMREYVDKTGCYVKFMWVFLAFIVIMIVVVSVLKFRYNLIS